MLLTKGPVKEFATGHTELICSVQPSWSIVIALMQLWELGMPLNPLLLQILQSWVKEILNMSWNFLLLGLKMKTFAPSRKCPCIFPFLMAQCFLIMAQCTVYWIGISGDRENSGIQSMFLPTSQVSTPHSSDL